MHAVVIDGGTLHWQQRPDPQADDHELLVAVRAAGVNGADLAQREGRYPAPPGWPPDIPGLEMAGEVLSVGRRVTRFRPGDRVMALVGGGAQATLVTVDESHALAVPDGVPWPEAGGFMEVFATAFDALFAQAHAAVGERVLISGAAGGVGCAGVQLAALAGARVTASVRDHALHDAVAELGAAEVIDPDEVAAGGPFDVVLELVGAAALPSALTALATRGRVVVIGVGSGARVEVDLLWLMARRAQVFGSTLRARSRDEKTALIAALGAQVVPALADRRLRVPVTETLPLRDAASAYERFATGGKLGKIVLVT